MYQKVIEQHGTQVAAVPENEAGAGAAAGFGLYIDARRFCHRAIAGLPPEAREIYRKRMDGVAERWYQQGASGRDLPSLRRVVDQAFCSSWGDDALELLADLAFQDGRFVEAMAFYDRLVADRPDDPYVFVHPDPSVDLAVVAAKKLLCRAAEGANPPGPADLEEFARRYPGASGFLTGRKGALAKTLAESLVADHLGPAKEPDSRWPTFAGSFQRSRVIPGPIDVGSMQWRVDLEKISLQRFQNEVMRGMAQRAGDGFARAPAGVSSDRAGRSGDRLRWLAGAGIQPQRSSARYRAEWPAGDRSGLEISARGGCPGSSGAAAQRRDSAVHVDGSWKPDLRSDGGAEPSVSFGHGRPRKLELDRGPRLEHPGEIALGAEVVVPDSSQPSDGPHQQPVGQLRRDPGCRRAKRLRRGERSPRADRELHRLFRRFDRVDALDPIRRRRDARRREQQLPVRRGNAGPGDRAGRFQSSAALARWAHAFLPDQPGRRRCD